MTYRNYTVLMGTIGRALLTLSLSCFWLTGQAKEEEKTSGAEKGTIEEIVVTAQKREEKLQDVPASIAVLTSQDLEKKNIVTFKNVLELTPNIATTPSYGDGTSNNVYMR